METDREPGRVSCLLTKVMVRFGLWLGLATGGTQRPDDLCGQNHQRGHRPQTVRFRLIAALGSNLANDCFTPQFRKIVGGAPRPIAGFRLAIHFGNQNQKKRRLHLVSGLIHFRHLVFIARRAVTASLTKRPIRTRSSLRRTGRALLQLHNLR